MFTDLCQEAGHIRFIMYHISFMVLYLPSLQSFLMDHLNWQYLDSCEWSLKDLILEDVLQMETPSIRSVCIREQEMSQILLQRES